MCQFVVVRANLVYGLTAEALEEDPDARPTPIDAGAGSGQLEASLNGGPQPFYVFEKIGHRGVHQHVGEVSAVSPAEAMRAALSTFPRKSGVVWWVFPVKSVRQSTPEDIEQLFQIAETKLYRDQGQYHTVAILRQIKEQKEQERTQDASGS
jgi:1,2-phenylacetyl-CoA epoxidase PaaB subunit